MDLFTGTSLRVTIQRCLRPNRMRLRTGLACAAFYMAGLGIPVLAQTCPVFALPAPTGPFGVGTTVLSPEVFPAGTHSSKVQIQLWYPAGEDAHGAKAPYVADPLLKLMREQKYYDQPDCVYEAWGRMNTHAFLDAAASTQRGFPLVLFMPGEGVSRASYTSFAEQLASDGNVVAAFDFVHDGFMLPPDDTPDAGSEADAAVAVNEWAQDASRFLDRFLASNAGYKLPRNLGEQVQRAQIAAMGHSLGGAAALQLCQTDVRVRACVDMDGSPFGEVAQKGLRTGALVLLSHVDHSDAELKAKGRTREQMEEKGRQRTAEWQKVLAPSGGAVWVVKIQGTGHFSFSDGPFTMPSTVTRFGGTIIDSKRGLSIITGALEAYLKSIFTPGSAFDPAPYPEATVILTRAVSK